MYSIHVLFISHRKSIRYTSWITVNKRKFRPLNIEFLLQRNWVFGTNSDFLIPISLQRPIFYKTWNSKLWILLDHESHNIRGLNHNYDPLYILLSTNLINLQLWSLVLLSAPGDGVRFPPVQPHTLNNKTKYQGRELIKQG